MSEHKGYVFILIAILLHAIPPVAIKYSYSSTNPLTSSMLWFISAMFWSALLLILTKKVNKLKKIKKHYKPLILFGFCNAFGVILFFYAVDIIGASLTSFLELSNSVYGVVFGMLILSERFNLKEITGVAIAVLGFILATYTGQKIILFGSLLYLLGQLVYSLSLVIVKKQHQNIDTYAFMFFRSWFIGIIYIILAVTSEQIIIPERNIWWVYAFIPLLSAVLGQVLQYNALKFVDFSKAMIIKNLQPFVVLILSFFILNEVLTGRQLTGGIVIVFGIIIMIIYKPNENKKKTCA